MLTGFHGRQHLHQQQQHKRTGLTLCLISLSSTSRCLARACILGFCAAWAHADKGTSSGPAIKAQTNVTADAHCEGIACDERTGACCFTSATSAASSRSWIAQQNLAGSPALAGVGVDPQDSV